MPFESPTHDPFGAVRRAIDASLSIDDDDRRWLLERCDTLSEAYYERTEFALPYGLIHADAHRGNMIRTRDGFLLCDWDGVCAGPREIDLIPTLQGIRGRFGLTERQRSNFSEADPGHDADKMGGLPGAARHAGSPAPLCCATPTAYRMARDELRLRLASLRAGDDRLWHPLQADRLDGMSVESVFPRLEPLLPQVQKPIQYVGGELDAAVKDWDAATVRWALMYPDAYEVGLPNQGVQILYEVLNEQPDVAGRADLRGLAGPRGADARARRAAVHGRRAPAGRAFDVLGRLVLHRARLHQPAHRARPGRHPAAARPTATDDDPIVLAGGHAAFNPEPIADFIDAAVLGDGEEACSRSPRSSGSGRPRARPGGRDELLLRLAAYRGGLRARVLRRRLPARRPDPAGRARTGRTCRSGSHKHTAMDLDEWPYPKKPLVPLAETVHERYAWRSSAAAPGAAGSARPA